jgi:hypothetical protein
VLAVVTAFVFGDWAASDRLANHERKLRRRDPSLPPSGAFDLSDLARGAIGCDDFGPTGPFAVIGFDREGRRLKAAGGPGASCRPGRAPAPGARSSPSVPAAEALLDWAEEQPDRQGTTDRPRLTRAKPERVRLESRDGERSAACHFAEP